MITINQELYNKMPDDIKACFNQIPNPSSEEVRECFPETKGDSPNRKERKGGHREIFVGTENNQVRNQVISDIKFTDSGNASRFFKSIIYQAKASKTERNKGCEGLEEKERIDYGGFHSEKGLIENNRNPENRKPTANNHPTVKPIALMQYLIKMVTPKGGIVLDPFLGTGTTACACVIDGFDCIGIEKLEHFAKVITPKRIEYWSEPNHWEDLKEHNELPNLSKDEVECTKFDEFLE